MQYGNLTQFEIRRALNKLGGEEGVRKFIQDYSDVQLEMTQLDKIVVGVEDPAWSRKPFVVLPEAAAYFKARRYSEATTLQEECVVYRGSLKMIGLVKRSYPGGVVRIWDVRDFFLHLGLKSLSLELLARLRAAYHDQPVDEWLNVPVCDFDTIMLLGHGKSSGLTIDRKAFSENSLVKLDSEWIFTR